MTESNCTNVKQRTQYTIKKGDIFRTNEGGTVIVLEYKDSRNITVVHDDDFRYVRNVSAGHLRDGKVKNPYFPSVSGVGYVGVGEHLSRNGRKMTRAYHRWRNMLERCYSSASWKTNPSYKGCKVHPDWHNFQNFAEWYYKNRYFDESFHLDKDILSSDGKLYSKDTCVLIPPEINHLFRDAPNRSDELLCGITVRESDGLISVQTHGKYIGSYKSVEDAHLAFSKAKYEIIMQISRRWEGLVDPRVTQALETMANSYLKNEQSN